MLSVHRVLKAEALLTLQAELESCHFSPAWCSFASYWPCGGSGGEPTQLRVRFSELQMIGLEMRKSGSAK